MSRANMKTATLRRGPSDAVRRGHPWVYREGVERTDANVVGDVVRVKGDDGAELGTALYDPESPIALRIYGDVKGAFDERFFGARIEAAHGLRERLFGDGATTAYRLLHGEGDRLPGFVVDRYADVAVARLDGGAAETHAEAFFKALWRFVEPLGVRSLGLREPSERGKERASGASKLRALFGDAPPRRVRVTEHGVPFVVDLAQGQKTGAFLDQRENRRRVGELARGRRVLNLFSYAGGFSLRAALGGASHTTSVDVAALAHATAQESFRAAGVDPSVHDFVTADVFAFLEAARKDGRRWDLVVSDPPSFAPNERSVARALSAYRSLHRACAAVLADGGSFCAASCSSHVSAEAFLATLDDATLQRGDLRLVELFGPPADHPTPAAWPEGRYLKFAIFA